MPAVTARPDPLFSSAPAAPAAPGPLPPAPDTSLPDGLVRLTRVLAVGSLLGLIVLGLAWELWLAPTGQRTWALKVLPLAFPLAGLLKRRLYTYRWVSLLVWLYFAEGIVRATSSSGLVVPLAWGQVVLCVVLFAACAMHVRHRLREAKARAQAAASAVPAGSLDAAPPNGGRPSPTPGERAT
jgi:uncharacterized membrane protein